jgi:hypothetical protein
VALFFGGGKQIGDGSLPVLLLRLPLELAEDILLHLVGLAFNPISTRRRMADSCARGEHRSRRRRNRRATHRRRLKWPD